MNERKPVIYAWTAALNNFDLVLNKFNEPSPANSITTLIGWVLPFPSGDYLVAMPTMPCYSRYVQKLLAMENNYGYLTAVMKQQVEVWQRGSVDFKHRCATRNPVFMDTEPRCLATQGNPRVSHWDCEHRVTSRQVVPLSGMHGAPVIICVKSVTLSCEIQIVRWVTLRCNWRKGISLYRWSQWMRRASSHRMDRNSCSTGLRTPGARCVVRPLQQGIPQVSILLCRLCNNIGLKSI